MEFPTGVNVNSASGFKLTYNGETGDGATITWGDVSGTCSYGSLYTSATATVNVTVDAGFTGDIAVGWTVVGDNYGADPHVISGTIDIPLYAGLMTDYGVTAIFPVTAFAEIVYPEITVINNGFNEIAPEITVVINDGTSDVYTSVLTAREATPRLESATYTMEDSYNFPEGNYTITATVAVPGDEDASNDEMTTTVVSDPAYRVAYAFDAAHATYNTLDLATGGLTYLGLSPYNIYMFPMAEEFAVDKIYRVYSDMTFGTVSPSGTYTQLGAMTGVVGTPTGLAYNWMDDEMYVMILVSPYLIQLYTLDLETYALTPVGAGTTEQVIAMDFADDGFLYGPSINTGKLIKIDPATGETTTIGDLGINVGATHDVTFDEVDNKLYTIASGETTSFGYYDLTTGAFNEIAPMAMTGVTEYACLVSTNTPDFIYEVTFNVKGYSNNPVEGANITVGSRSFVTNAAGIVKGSFADGAYDISIEKFGYHTYDDVLVVDGADMVEYLGLIALDAEDMLLSFENAVGTPIDASVVITYMGETVFSGTASGGQITFSNVPVNTTYTFDFTCPGYEPITGISFEFIGTAIDPIIMEEIIEMPKALNIEVTGQDALFTWENQEPYTISYYVEPSDYDDINATYQSANLGYGVIFNLAAYPDAVISTVDFHHAAWGHTGTWDYRFHIVDMTDNVSAAVTGTMQTTADNKWETGISLGDVDGLGGKQVGIYLEALSMVSGSQGDEYYPCLSSDFGTVNSHSYRNVDLTTFEGTLNSVATPFYDGLGEWLMNLTILTEYGEQTLKSTKAFQSYTVSLDGSDVATGITEKSYLFTNVAEGNHTAGVKAVYETGSSAPATIDFVIEAVSGVTEETAKIISVYPNPTDGEVNIRVTEASSIAVLDVTGKLVSTADAKANSITKVTLPTGIYLIKVETGGKVASYKVIVK